MDDKSFKITLLEKMLRYMSRVILWHHKPFVIGITGSVGKTTTKDVIVHILKKHKTIYYTKKNYNNEIGVPMTILGIDKDIDSIEAFVMVIVMWIKKIFSKQYPEILVVEMGVDRPGDMEYLTSIVQPDISVLTAISYAHSEFFDDIDAIVKEKQKIVTNMKKTGVAIVNYDDKNTRSVGRYVDNHIITYGINDKAEFIASDIEVCFHKCHNTGLSFKLRYDGKVIPVRLNHVIAQHLVYAILAGLVVVVELEMNMIDVVGEIADFEGSPGRMQLLDGKNGSKIIDDTYNASPNAMSAAIKTLEESPYKRKIAVLGDMRELGRISKVEHEKVAEQLLSSGIREIFLVGVEMKFAYDKLREDNAIVVAHFDTSNEAVEDIEDCIQSGDVILVKGSRGIYMENIVKELLSNKHTTI